MTRVLRIGNRFNLGGPTYNMAYLTRHMGPEFETLLVGGPHEASEASSDFILDSLGVQPVILPEMGREIDFAQDRLAYKKLRSIIREFKPDIVHTHASKAGALGRLAAKKEKVPIVLHTFHGHVFHSYFGHAKTLFYKTVERYLAKHSTRIIAISEAQKQELANKHQICPLDKIEVVPLGFDLSRFANLGKNSGTLRRDWQLGDRPLVGIIGRLVPIKNHAMFLEVVAGAKQTGANFTAVIVGDGESRNELIEQCKGLNLTISTERKSSNTSVDVVFTSWIKDVETVYGDLDISVLTSLNEGTPVSIIESLASGVPVLSTNVGGVKDIVTDGKSGKLFNLEQIEEMSKALVQLLSEPEYAHEMGDFGRKVVLKNYTYTRLVEDMTALYSQLLRDLR